MAPEATLISGSRHGIYETHASNHSYVMSYGNYNSSARSVGRDIRGAGGLTYQRPHIGAVANQGLTPQYNNEEGYYSIYAPAKNTIGVGSVNANDGYLTDFSRLGPSFDGRIKPDLMGAGCKNFLPLDVDTSEFITVHIDYIAHCVQSLPYLLTRHSSLVEITFYGRE
jgi:hypothetical protein